MRAWWPVLLLVVGCTDAMAPSDDVVDPGGKGDGDTAGFSEVDPDHSNATFRNYIEAAIAHLERDPSEIAQLTARSIRERRVRIDELVDLTCWDFTRAVADLPDSGLTADDWHHLHDRGSTAAQILTDNLDGYMWSNRIYVSRGLRVRELASTLVHEVNHVINRSEVGYYDDLPTSGFLHEYRSFYAESVFDPDAWQDIDLVDYVIENYELDRAQIHPEALAEPLTPRLLPDDDAWQARDVTADVPDDDATCPSNQ